MQSDTTKAQLAAAAVEHKKKRQRLTKLEGEFEKVHGQLVSIQEQLKAAIEDEMAAAEIMRAKAAVAMRERDTKGRADARRKSSECLCLLACIPCKCLHTVLTSC